MNGDRYPDLIGAGQVQYTLGDGSLDSTRLGSLSGTNTTDNESISFSN